MSAWCGNSGGGIHNGVEVDEVDDDENDNVTAFPPVDPQHTTERVNVVYLKVRENASCSSLALFGQALTKTHTNPNPLAYAKAGFSK